MAKITIGEKYYIHSCVVTFLLFLFYILGVNTSFLYTSILDYKSITSDSFDGTVYPIEFVPDPMALTYEQRKQPFDTINSKYFIKTPLYNPDIFGKNIDTLLPGSKDYKDTITQRVIFTVPYAGSYNFDYKEYSGSHPGVDIIAPIGTPVRNMAAGVVVDVGYQGGGFGNYVLVKHNGVPLPNGRTGNIYSLYGHMSKTVAQAGTKIAKGTVVGYVGQSGTATTPHLHFQIDLDTAPFSPYWPFTTLDMKTAGVGFFDGINIGLGKENVMKYTISPLKFVNDNLNFHSNTSNILLSNTQSNSLAQDENKNTQTNTGSVGQKTQTHNTLSGTQTLSTPDNQDITLNNDSVKNGNTVKQEQVIKKDVTLLNTLDPSKVLSTTGDITLPDNGDIASLNNNDESVTNTGSQNSTTQSGNTFSGTIFKDISSEYKFLTQLTYFKDKKIISGFADNTFRPTNNITRIESLKMILLSFGISPIKDEKARFVDIISNSWENTYVNAGVKSNIISLDNQKFDPERNVSRVEALKIILTLAGVDINSIDATNEWNDVKKTDWFYKYVVYAVKNNLIEVKDNNFLPNQSLTREELISILYKMIQK